MNPDTVNPNNFKVNRILFNNNSFSIAFGTWKNGNKAVGMRWNGEEDEVGYPKTFGHPMWFIIDEEVRLPILRSLIGLSNSNKTAIEEVINEIIK